jgi:DNA processing protein
MTELKYWLWLSSCPGLGLDGCYRVLERFGSPMAAYHARPQEYRLVPGLRPLAWEGLEEKSMDRADRILSRCDKLGVRISAIKDSDYPARLRTIYRPPLVLYQQGKLIRLDDEVAIAMAGTRNCSEYGRQMADKLSRELTRQGGLVVTGVVAGCDTAAVKGALRAGGPVVCVLAGGVDVPYDQYSHDLYARVRENGLLISEHPPGREAKAGNFPQRNRILTGVALGTLCVEGKEDSGTMLVAKNAADQGRDIFVVPTGADRPQGAGMLALLKAGCIPVTRGSEILSYYQSQFPDKIHLSRAPEPPVIVLKPYGLLEKDWDNLDLPQEAQGDADSPEEEEETTPVQPRKKRGTKKVSPTNEEKTVDKPENKDYIDVRNHPELYSDDEQEILICLQEGDMTGDSLIEHTELPARRVLSALTILTLRGLVEEVGGKYHPTIRVKPECDESHLTHS